MFEDLLYPNTEFLFEVSPLGAPALPCQYYVSREDNIDKIAAFYLERLPQFDIELDEVLEGHRHLRLTKPEFMTDILGMSDDPNLLLQRIRELDGTLIGVEIIHSGGNLSLSRSVITWPARDHAGDIPEDSSIIILEYVKYLLDNAGE